MCRNERGWKALLSTVAKSSRKGFLGISPNCLNTFYLHNLLCKPFNTMHKKINLSNNMGWKALGLEFCHGGDPV